MGSIGRRLERLEGRTPAASPEGRESLLEREVLTRMTDAELDACEAAVERQAAGEAPTKEDRAIAGRAEALRGEVARELGA